ncbi:MAG: helix-turn-helix transcriptional regulator [Acidobacteriaceae bacterium]|nr:helix-turn-helix transcriptional regulator [Acidobacteriaceae bacterium]
MIKLSPRQGQIADLIRRGLTARQIAQELGISVKTVAEHKRLLYARLQLGGRTKADSLRASAAC